MNKIMYIGNDYNFIRFYPNPGFGFTIGRRLFKWSKFYGWNDKRGITKPSYWPEKSK